MSFHIFGYGSLIWNPGFVYKKKVNATLMKYQRSLCMYSWSLRGTPKKPGLVLGLTKNNDSFCRGVVYEIDLNEKDKILSYLIQRENTPFECYDILMVPIEIESKMANVLCFVSKEEHPQYAGHLTDDEKVKIISTASGKNGTSLQYFKNTIIALKDAGIEDKELNILFQKLITKV
jgi:glutathione-specific gamma-glutamylcyclotransferase